MASRSLITTALFSLCCAVAIGPADAVETSVSSVQPVQSQNAAPQAAAVDKSADFPMPPDDKELEKRPADSKIYQVDTEPLGNRRPLLLIHGGNGDIQAMFRWDKVIPAFKDNEKFRNMYKIYLLRYNSAERLQETVPKSCDAIMDLYHRVGNKPIYVMALSMGGNVAQEALVRPDVDNAIAVVFALATPFHGSPLFSPDWFQYSIYKSHALPGVRELDSLDYRVYFKRHHNYQEDLKWDDVDALMPTAAGDFKSRVPLGPKGQLSSGRDDNRQLAEINKEIKVNKNKIIAYAGYLTNPYAVSSRAKRVEMKVLSPFKALGTLVTAEFGNEESALKVLNGEISKVKVDPDTAKQEEDLAKNPHAYDLNDGITPVTSALFLRSDVAQKHPIVSEKDLQQLRDLIDIRYARVFKDIDHVTFVEGVPPHRGSKLVVDQLHPDEEPKPMFDWLINQLLVLP